MAMSRVTIALLAALLLTGAEAASAQYRLLDMNVEGEVETGVRFLVDPPSQNHEAKFQEYKDIDNGLYLQRFYLRAFTDNEGYSATFAGSEWGSENQNFSLTAGRLGKWEFGFEWDQLRHVLYTNTRFLANETDRGVFVLPSPRPSLQTHNTADEKELSVRWDTARIGLRVTPTPNLDIKAEYTRIRKDGDRPFGMAFGGPGNNFYEVIEPIEHTIHDVRLAGVYAADNWQMQFGYTASIFQNDERRIVADNPCFGLAQCATGGATPDNTGPTRGQSSLPPSNMAHTFSLAGGVSLPMRSRLSASVGYSIRLQNESFLPHTINPAIDGNPDLVLPQKSLNGNVQVLTANLSGTTRPWRYVGLTAKYRYYEQFDLSDQPTFSAVAVDDRSITAEAHRAHHLDFSRQNVDLDSRFTFFNPVPFTLGFGWERWDRNEGREAQESDEFFAKLAIDANPTDWMQARLTYRPSWRRIGHYDTFAHQAHVVAEEEATASVAQSVDLRKFDESNRNRQRIELGLTFTPVETIAISPTAAWRYDDYKDSKLGLQEEWSWSAGMDVNFTPSQWFSFAAGYMYEKIEQKQNQRSRPVTGGVASDFADYEWISNNVDTVQTAHVALRGAIIPRVLDWAIGGSWSYALGRMDTSNPMTPQSGTAAQDLTATAKPIPAFEDQLIRIDAALKYHFAKSWTATFGYAFESFEKHDWRTDQLNPFVAVPSVAGLPGQTSIWLGGDLKNYGTHILGASLAYRFGR